MLHNRHASHLDNRKEISIEENRRKWAEALFLRTKAGGIRPDSDFPSVRDVVQDVQGLLIQDALAWTEKACALHGSHPALPATIRDVLVHTFTVCREEVERCLDIRLQGLSGFMGNQEAISLSSSSGECPMNLDAKYVLYECLRKDYRKIVPTKPDNMRNLAASIVGRCERPDNIAKAIVSGDAWPSFEALMQHYTTLFVEASLMFVVPGGVLDESVLKRIESDIYGVWFSIISLHPKILRVWLRLPFLVLHEGNVVSPTVDRPPISAFNISAHHSLSHNSQRPSSQMKLQDPPMDLKDVELDENTTFDVRSHRNWAPRLEIATGQQCSVVFPALRTQGGGAISNVKVGVVRTPV